MGLRKPSEERFFPRYYNVAADFSGKLIRQEAAQVLEAKVLDVSRDGLGVLLGSSVGQGETLELVLHEKHIAMTVVYCMDDLIHKGKFRCGLQRIGSTENLVSLFAAAGALGRD